MKSVTALCILVVLGLSVSLCMSEDEVTNNTGLDSESIEDKQPVDKTQDSDENDNDNSYDPESEETIDKSSLETDKRVRFGSVLGKGFSFGKRFGSVLGKGFSLGKRYGNLFGKGFGFGKRYNNEYNKEQRMSYRPRWTFDDDFLFNGNGIRYDGIKRSSDFDDLGEDFEFVDLDGPVDEKRSESGDNDEYAVSKRSKRDVRKRRFIQYYGNLMGRGLSLGRRSDGGNDGDALDDFDADEGSSGIAKRLYSNILGKGYMFGKRRSDRRKLFGNWLGRGYTFGKRSDNQGQPGDDENEYQLDEEEEAALQNSPSKRYIMSSPGHRFKFGKRFGYILGRGFSFGKRAYFNAPQSKRPFGLMLGRGFSFGKRSAEVVDEIPGMDSHFTSEQLLNNPELENYEKRGSFILGRGYMFGKRGHKRFGHILGNGFSFGKRSGDMDVVENDEDDVNIFVDNNGNMFVFTDDLDFSNAVPVESDDIKHRVITCDGEVVPYFSESFLEFEKHYQSYLNEDPTPPNPLEQHYFTDGFGNDFILLDDIASSNVLFNGEERGATFYGCFGDIKELVVDNDETVDDNRNIPEKRGKSWKRFGHILGRGFSFGK